MDQWLHIRGRNRDNPVLLYIHDGPGGPVIGHGLDPVLRLWEDYFTVVLWDQRQIGKSYYPANDENEPFSVHQHIEDTAEIVDYLRAHLEKDKVVLMGAGWGGVLGMHIVKNHPEWVHAYVGVGQLVNPLESERVLYQRLLGHAKEQNNIDLIAILEAAIPLLDAEYPQREKSYAENYPVVRQGLSLLAGESYMHHFPIDSMGKMISLDRAISPHWCFSDITNAIMGDIPALFRAPYKFTQDFLGVDLPKDIGSSFDVPIFFFTGIHDWQSPASLSGQWLNDIDAPHKEIVHFEESSHIVINEEPGRFMTQLVNKVLPFTQ